MSLETPEKQDADFVQLDGYGLRVTAKPRAPEDGAPQTWKEVWSNVHGSLRRIASEPLALVADVLSASRSIIRGIGNLPSALATRIKRGHELAEKGEGEAQSKQRPDPNAAIANLENEMDRLRGQGIHVQLVPLSDGGFGLLAVGPDKLNAAVALLQDAEGEKGKSLPNRSAE